MVAAQVICAAHKDTFIGYVDVFGFKSLVNSRTMNAWKIITALFILIVAVCGKEAAAQNSKPVQTPLTRGTEKVIFFQRFPGVDCYTFRRYAVIEEQDKTAVGNNILVKYMHLPSDRFPCKYAVGNSDFEIKNRIGNSFLGLAGDLIFIESSTGANVDGLTIYNLSRGKKVYETGIADDKPVEFVGPGKVTLWEPAREATKEDCPQYDRIKADMMQPTLEEQYTLDLSTFTLTFTHKTHCSAYE